MSAKTLKIREDKKTSEVDRFLEQLAVSPAVKRSNVLGRLIFALDATMSRQPTWDRACQIQSEMFSEAEEVGGLEIQLIYFRGFRECKASNWMNDTRKLLKLMTQITCQGGYTQIQRVLRRAIKESRRHPVQALVYVGDCVEEEIDPLCALAGELGLQGVPAFMFQEGLDSYAASAFQEIARLTGGVWCRFDTNSPQELGDLLKAVAVYAAGGYKVLVDYGKSQGGEVLRLAQLMDKSG